MNLVALTEYLVKNIVKEPDMVSVKEFADSEDVVNIQVLVSSDDMGRVVGHKGSTIHSIRTLVQASSSIHNNKRVEINVDSY